MSIMLDYQRIMVCPWDDETERKDAVAQLCKRYGVATSYPSIMFKKWKDGKLRLKHCPWGGSKSKWTEYADNICAVFCKEWYEDKAKTCHPTYVDITNHLNAKLHEEGGKERSFRHALIQHRPPPRPPHRPAQCTVSSAARGALRRAPASRHAERQGSAEWGTENSAALL